MKKQLIIGIIILTIILSGCNSSSNKNTIKTVDLYKGTDGLDFEFLKDSPPNEIYSNQSFQIITLIKNKGPYAIDNARIILSYDNTDFYFKGSKDYTFSLNGKDVYNTRNDEKIKSFYVQAIPLLPNSEFLQSTILATACYGYQNKLTTDICIDIDPYNLMPVEKPCKITDQSFSGQGGPVGVSKIEQKTIVSDKGVRPQFLIYIKNFGQGQVISKDKIQDLCGSQKISKEDLNGITLKDLSFSQYKYPEDIECEPQNLKIFEKEEFFVCTLKDEKEILKEESSYKTSLNIEFDYGYTITKSKDITIKKMKIR